MDTIASAYSWNGGRLDAQHWSLPSQFSNETLLNILIVDNGDNSFQRVMLSAITICGKEKRKKKENDLQNSPNSNFTNNLKKSCNSKTIACTNRK